MYFNTNQKNLDSNMDFYTLFPHKVGSYIFLKSLDRQYVYANPAMLNHLNCGLNQIQGAYDSDFFELTDLTERLKSDNSVLDLGETIISEESSTIKSTGNERIFLSEKSPVYNNNNEIIGLISTATDISDLASLRELY